MRGFHNVTRSTGRRSCDQDYGELFTAAIIIPVAAPLQVEHCHPSGHVMKTWESAVYHFCVCDDIINKRSLGSTPVRKLWMILEWSGRRWHHSCCKLLTQKIKERYLPEWTKVINEDDMITMVKLIIICHSSTGKASEFTDKFIAVEEYRNFNYKEGTSIAEYVSLWHRST